MSQGPQCHRGPVGSANVLEVRISDHIEPLVGLLAEHLAAPPDDPFAPEWVAVPSIGMRRWLAQRLSHELGTALGGDGVSANIGLPFPAELRRSVLAADAAARGDGERDPWDRSRLTWVVLEVLSDPVTVADPVLGPLTPRTGGGTLAGRATALADLLDRYVLHRPTMLASWAAGHDTDAVGGPIPAAQRWQPALFRAVHRRIGQAAPPERMDGLLRRLRTGDLVVPGLPERLFLFGLSTLPADIGPLLHALAERHRVHALLLTPSVTLARTVATAARRPARRTVTPVDLARREHDSSAQVHHPLLRSWGTASRETATLLGVFNIDVQPVGAVGGQASLFDAVPTVPGTDTLLGRLQADIRLNRRPGGPAAGAHGLADDDRSIQVHACTGATRQVEVLRDALLHQLAEHPDLTEGDIVVMCPRIEAFSPVIQAVLGPSADGAAPGSGTGAHAPRLRYRITDRAIRAEVPLLGVVAGFLDLLPGRFTASAVADFLGLGPVRDRFGLSPEDLGRLDEWIERSQVRWGLDGEHRVDWGLPPGFRHNSWSAGLDQILMGTAVRTGDLTMAVGEIPPLSVGDGSAVAAARVADAVRTLAELRVRFQGSRPVGEWCVLLGGAVDLLCSLPPSESWQRRRLDQVVAQVLGASVSASGEPSEVSLTLADVRRLLADHLGGEPSRAAFGSGAITFCSLSPLRSVPHRVVCLLGFDQDALPRGVTSGDDLLAAAPSLGDRDPRAETRQLLLEAVLAAQRSLVITCGAADVRTNAPVPPAVALDELWDTLAEMCRLSPEDIRAHLQTDHPRQAFAAANFSPDGLAGRAAPTGPWSFDPQARSGAVALRDRSIPPVSNPLVDRPLPPPSRAKSDRIVQLDDLTGFLRKPVQTFFTHRLQLRLPHVDDESTDDLPVQLGYLERFKVGESMLAAAVVAGAAPADLVRVLRARGALPPGSLGDELVDQLTDEIDDYVRAAGELDVPMSADVVHQVDVDLGDGRLLRGSVPGQSGDRPGPLRVQFTRPKHHHRARLAVHLFALTAQDPSVQWRSVGLYRGATKGRPVTEHVLTVSGDGPADRRSVALHALRTLVALRDDGLCLPLPLFDATSLPLAVGRFADALAAWGDEPDGECADAYHRLAFGTLTFSELLSVAPGGRTASEVATLMWGTIESALSDPTPPPDVVS